MKETGWWVVQDQDIIHIIEASLHEYQAATETHPNFFLPHYTVSIQFDTDTHEYTKQGHAPSAVFGPETLYNLEKGGHLYQLQRVSDDYSTKLRLLMDGEEIVMIVQPSPWDKLVNTIKRWVASLLQTVSETSPPQNPATDDEFVFVRDAQDMHDVHPQTETYNIAAIRSLLLAAFDAEELRRFCQDHSSFRPVVNRFGPGLGLDGFVARVIDYCDKQALFDELLSKIRDYNPRQFAHFKPYRFHKE